MNAQKCASLEGERERKGEKERGRKRERERKRAYTRKEGEKGECERHRKE